MSRVIKFRAWETGEETMHSNVTSGVYQDPDEIMDFDYILSLARFKVMQFTGLHDKNGVEIYEGDIVRIIDDDGDETIGKVEWGLNSKGVGTYPAFYIWEFESEMNSFSEIFDSGNYEIEVGGNIYENPDLLEVPE